MAINKTRAGSLAALAGLAYMASQKGKKGEDSGLTAADREDAEMGRAMRANAASTPTSADKEAPAPFEADFPRQDEPKLNEYGETYTLNDTAPAPKATPRSRPTIAGKTGSGSGGGRGPKAGEEAAYRRSLRDNVDGGKSVVDRQNAGAKKAGLSVNDYYDSGKAKIDEQDAEAASKRSSIFDKRPGIMARMREADKEIKGVRPYRESREPAADLSSAYSGADVYKRGGKVKKMASGGMTSSASKRADGIATKGKTRGRMC